VVKLVVFFGPAYACKSLVHYVLSTSDSSNCYALVIVAEKLLYYRNILRFTDVDIKEETSAYIYRMSLEKRSILWEIKISVKLVEALCYKPEVRRVKFRMMWTFFSLPNPSNRTMALGSAQESSWG
jgi:hypothetical protein